MALYFDRALYNTPSKYFEALAALTDFWDTITENTLTKGGITLTVSGSNISISGYTYTASNTITSSTGLSKTCIAYTENGIIGYAQTSGSLNASEWAIGCNDNGEWGAVIGKDTKASISELIAEGVSATTFGGGTVTSSNENVQIVDVCADKGNFIFEDIKRILQSPQTAYVGKMEMDNGEKYVQCWALALKYTE